MDDDGYDTGGLLEVSECPNCGEYFSPNSGFCGFCSKSCFREYSKYKGEKQMKKSYICHFYGEDPVASKKSVQNICRTLVGLNNFILPIAPQLYFDQFSSDEKDRDKVMSWCLDLIMSCDELLVFGPKMSKGMVEEIIFAICLGNIHISLGGSYYPKFSNGKWEFDYSPVGGFSNEMVKKFNDVYKSALRIREHLKRG